MTASITVKGTAGKPKGEGKPKGKGKPKGEGKPATAVPVKGERAGFTPTAVAKKLAKGVTATATTSGQMRVTGVPGGSMSKFARWCGYHGYTKQQCHTYLEACGVTIDPTTLNCQWGSGSSEAAGGKGHHGLGSTVEVSAADIKAINAKVGKPGE